MAGTGPGNGQGGSLPERPRQEPYFGEDAIRDPQSVLIRSKLAPDLLEALSRGPSSKRATYSVIIEMNENFPGGAKLARELLFNILKGESEAKRDRLLREASDHAQGVGTKARLDGEMPLRRRGRLFEAKSRMTPTYAFARLNRSSIEDVARLTILISDRPKPIDLVHRIWLDHELQRFVFKSAQTIKADAAISAFDCEGRGIVWAVADTGIDGDHPHFQLHRNLVLPAGIRHRDFTRLDEQGGNLDEAEKSALVDEAGHGTHVAGIIAGETIRADHIPAGSDDANTAPKELLVKREIRLSQTQVGSVDDNTLTTIRSIAPLCKLVSLKVLDANRRGNVSDILAAIGYIQEVNDHGRRIRIHGLNLSVGYTFDPQWFAPGQSALCVEVNRLVKCGVVVVAAAGNAGYGRVTTHQARSEPAAFMCTISDPGNAEQAITVGSTHRDMPHTYGVSYFSSKGPTADGRPKPDLVAPGERIVSCAANMSGDGVATFKEDSGTSMATPHVSGAIAAFLSVRGEFIGQPERVKEIFANAATDLRRRNEFQGGGVLDLMRTLQSV